MTLLGKRVFVDVNNKDADTRSPILPGWVLDPMTGVLLRSETRTTRQEEDSQRYTGRKSCED